MSTAIDACTRFKELSSDEGTHAMLMGAPEILAGLVSYMNNTDEQVLILVSSTIKTLTKNSTNLPTLYNVSGLLTSLTDLTGSNNHKVKKNSISALKRLNHYGKSLQQLHQPNQQNNENNSTINNNNNHHEMKATDNKRKNKTKSKKTRTFVFYVTLDDNQLCSKIEKQVLQVRGLISLTLDQRRNQVLIGTTRKKKEIKREVKDAISKAGGTVTKIGQVGKEPKKVEVETQIQVEEEEEDGYLDEEDVYGADREGVLSRFGSSSLQARLAEQRRKQLERDNQKSSTAALAQVAGNTARAAMSWFGY